MLDLDYIPEQYREKCPICFKELERYAMVSEISYYCNDNTNASNGITRHFSYKININTDKICQIVMYLPPGATEAIYVYNGYNEDYYINTFEPKYKTATHRIPSHEFNIDFPKIMLDKIIDNQVLE